MKRIAIAAAASLLLAQAHATTVRVHYAAGKDGIQVRADKGAAGWSQGVPATPEGGPLNVWTFTWADALGDIQMKPALGADKVSIGGVYRVPAGATLCPDPPAAGGSDPQHRPDGPELPHSDFLEGQSGRRHDPAVVGLGRAGGGQLHPGQGRFVLCGP